MFNLESGEMCQARAMPSEGEGVTQRRRDAKRMAERRRMGIACWVVGFLCDAVEDKKCDYVAPSRFGIVELVAG